jgi:hypothetical protein
MKLDMNVMPLERTPVDIILIPKPVIPIPVAARSKAYVCGRFVAGIAGSNTAEGMDICLLWLCCVVLCR